MKQEFENLQNKALPPKNTIKNKALPPKDTIKPKSLLKKINEMVKGYGVWAVAFLFLQELVSLFFWDDENYKNFYYPILNQFALLILLLNIFVWKNKLNFCVFKKYGIIALILYYLCGILAMIFKIEIYINYISYYLLGISIVLMIFSIKKIQNEIK